jgi:hypothetical protein
VSKVGGAREGAGRKPGSPNRRNVEVVAAALAEGITPVEFMLAIMRDEDADPKRREWAAEKAAPYLHPRPAPLERTVAIELPDTSTVAGIDQALDVLIKAMGASELSPAEGQSFISVIETRRKAIETGDMLERLKKLEEQIEKRPA